MEIRKIILLRLPGQGMAGKSCADGLLNSGIVQLISFDPVEALGGFALGEELHGSDTFLPHGSQKIERFGGGGAEASLDSAANGVAVGEQIVEEAGDHLACVGHVAGVNGRDSESTRRSGASNQSVSY